jgi:hypothetical protein
MKAAILTVTLALAAVTATDIGAQTVVTTAPTLTTYQGVVSQVDPTSRTIIIQAPGATEAPVTYTYTPDTVFVDSAGNTVSYENIRNSQVRLEYETNGGRTIVRRVVTTTVAPPAPPVVIHR